MRINSRTWSKPNRPPPTLPSSSLSSTLWTSTTIPNVSCSIKVSSPESKIPLPTSEEPPPLRFSWIKQSASISESISVGWRKRKALRPAPSPPLPVSQAPRRLESAQPKTETPTSRAPETSRSHPNLEVRNDPLPKVLSPNKRSLVVSQKASACTAENLATCVSIAPKDPSQNQSR